MHTPLNLSHQTHRPFKSCAALLYHPLAISLICAFMYMYIFTPILQGDSCSVKLFSVTQNSVLDNLLDFNSRIQSQKLASIVQYLRVATSAVAMPKGHSLTKLWELITDPILSITHS